VLLSPPPLLIPPSPSPHPASRPARREYNPNFVDAVLAMEERANLIGVPVPLKYVFPNVPGLVAADAQRLLSLGLDPTRILPDIHTGAAGGVEAAAAIFASPPVPGFTQGAIVLETNAQTHDLQRGLDEASDLIDFFTAPTNVTDRIYARAASFCAGSASVFDEWPQAISFFLQNMTFLQPPGWAHAMISQTWAETTLAVAWANASLAIPFAAQRTANGSTLVLRAVNQAATPVDLNVTLVGGKGAAGPSYALTTLGGIDDAGAENTPGNPTGISPVKVQRPLAAGSAQITLTLPQHSFVVAVVGLA
jgi:hypothetical protein